jgi:tetratricopeptide (TPR) repeat protein
VTLVHAAEYRLFGTRPLPYHVSNVALHVATTGLVYALLRTLGLSLATALLGALLFGIHPLQVENVAWIASRKTLLAGLFGVGTFGLALRGRWSLASGSYLLAAMSKGTVVVVPLWIAIAWLLGFGSRRPARRDLAWLAALGVVAAARATLTALAQADVVERTAVVGLGGRLLLMGPVLATELRQLLLPLDLSPVYPWSALSVTEPGVWIGWGVVLIAIAGCVAWGRRSRHAALLGAVAGVGLLPTLNLWPAPFLQADRYLHLALVGLAPLAVLATLPLARLRAWAPAALVLGWCALLGVPTTLAQIGVWRSSETLWREVLSRNPDFADAHANLGEHYLTTGRFDEARPELERALALDPDHGPARFNLALLHTRTGAPEQAERELRAAVARDPNDAAAHGLLGRALARQGRIEEALAELDTALEQEPGLAAARLVRARLRARTGGLEGAASDFEVLIAAGHDEPGVLNDLAAIRMEQGRPEEAVVLASRATTRQPDLAMAWDTLAAALLTQGKIDEAARAIERGLEANPALADLHYRRARLHELRGDPDGASESAREALERLGTGRRPWRSEAERLAR